MGEVSNAYPWGRVGIVMMAKWSWLIPLWTLG